LAGTTRRNFIRHVSAGGLAFAAAPTSPPAAAGQVPGAGEPASGRLAADIEPGVADRSYWVNLATRLANPVLANLALGRLRERLPVSGDRAQFASLEALGRLLCGIAPWLELGGDSSPEGGVRNSYADLARVALGRAVDPASPDYMNFERGTQPLVDAAFLAQAILRAPVQLWDRLSSKTRQQVLEALRKTRIITPHYSNWLLFSAMVETFFRRVGADWDRMRIDLALRTVTGWYVGDGTFGDGPEYRWDYYNSFVIQPFLLDICSQLAPGGGFAAEIYPMVRSAAQRYAAVQERLIAPDGTYPPIGRSLAYRIGAFQLLSQMALRRELPPQIPPGQVRTALTAVMRRQMDAPGTFDHAGWLTVGFAGSQPAIGEGYICVGSCYLCAAGLVALGLPADDRFWMDPAAPWTSARLWSGDNLPPDAALYLKK
jgi:hypothetical protein